MPAEWLFRGPLLSTYLEAREESLREAVGRLGEERLGEEGLAARLAEQFRVRVPVLEVGRAAVVEHREAQVETRDPVQLSATRRGYRTVVAVPYAGEREVFAVRASAFGGVTPRAEVLAAELRIACEFPEEDVEAAGREYARVLAAVREQLARLEAGASPFNRGLEGLAARFLRVRRQEFEDPRALAELLGLGMREPEPTEREKPAPAAEGDDREYEEALRAVRDMARVEAGVAPFHRGLEALEARFLRVRRQEFEDPRALAELLGLGMREPEPTEREKPAPAAEGDDREYEEALRAVRDMARVMELDPAAFAELGEEDLRSHFLVQLNGRFGGQATGETFNFRGKTDILVRRGGRNVLIAECKFWAGETELLSATDQLLSYLSWRDTRAALILFSRTASFSQTLETIDRSMTAHPCFRRRVGAAEESSFRYGFANPRDEAREVLVTVLAFDLPRLERGRGAPPGATRERRMQALLEVLGERGALSYEELAREMEVPRDYVQDLVTRQMKGSGLLRKRRRGTQVLVGLRVKKEKGDAILG